MARIIERCTRRADLVARYGGEEFVVVLPGAGETGALEIAERIRDGVASPFAQTGGLAISIGVATYPEIATTKIACWRRPTAPCTRPSGRVATGWSRRGPLDTLSRAALTPRRLGGAGRGSAGVHEVDHVAVLHDVLLALGAQLSGLAGDVERAAGR